MARDESATDAAKKTTRAKMSRAPRGAAYKLEKKASRAGARLAQHNAEMFQRTCQSAVEMITQLTGKSIE